MPRGKKQNSVPPWGRSMQEIEAEISDNLREYSADVPPGNTDPTVVRGVIYGGMPNYPRMARGRLRTFRGKYK